MLRALIGTGMACVFANRRLDRHRVPTAARAVEAVLVTVVAVLRYESLHIQGADLLTALGAALLAGLISALVLLGIEEIVVETRTFAMLMSAVRVSWKRWRLASAQARVAKIQARIESTVITLERHYLESLLQTVGLPLDDADGAPPRLRRPSRSRSGEVTPVKSLAPVLLLSLVACSSLRETPTSSATKPERCGAPHVTELILGAHQNAPKPFLPPAAECRVLASIEADRPVRLVIASGRPESWASRCPAPRAARSPSRTHPSAAEPRVGQARDRGGTARRSRRR